MRSVHYLANGDITARFVSHYLARGRHYLRLRTLPILKIAVSFISLIPSLILPRDDRQTTERRAKRYRALAAKNSALFLRLLSKKVVSIPKKVDSHPKKVDSFPETIYLSVLNKNRTKKRFLLLNPK